MKWYVRYFLKGLAPAACARLFGKSVKCGDVPFGKESDGFLLEQGINIVQTLGQSGFNFSGSTLLELGMGRQPIMPIIMSFLNPKAIYIVDAYRLLHETFFRDAVRFLLEEHGSIAERLLIDPAWIKETLTSAFYMPLDEMLRHFRIALRTPDVTGRLNIADEHVDLAFTFDALEHCSRVGIKGYITECKRVLKSSGRMFHTIDTADHWSRSDRSITSTNFLKFEDRDWQFFCQHPHYYQNRLRQADYESLFENGGFSVDYCIAVVDPKAAAAIDTTVLAEKFRDPPKESLGAISLQFMCIKKRENVQERILKNAAKEFRRRQRTLTHGDGICFVSA